MKTQTLFQISSLALMTALNSGVKPARADVKLHSVFSDNSILQRDKPVPIWGTASVGERVTVQIAGQTQSAVADNSGRWMVRLKPLRAHWGRDLVAHGKNIITLRNVAVGDVYLCSGQSNMQWGLIESQNGASEVAGANHPNIRLLSVSQTTANTPRGVFASAIPWQVCTPQSAREFSAVAYFFGRELHQKLKVPIGLIDSSWGGTRAQSWTSRQTLATMPEYQAGLAEVDAAARATGNFDQRMTSWWQQQDARFARADFEDASWPQMTLPTGWESAGLPGFDGMVWFRKTIEVPADWAGNDLMLHLGAIDDRDATYFNGQLVGAGNGWAQNRHYRVPGALVQAGRNVVAVQVLDTGGGGGVSGGDDLRLERAGAAPISLQGAWKYGARTPLAGLSEIPIDGGNNPNQNTVLYNAMIAPLVPLSMRGVIWYQGESNDYNPTQYATLFPALIRDWRANFGQEFGFYFVQLANFRERSKEPQNSRWAEMREAQTGALALARTGMAVAIDIGDAGDIHPRNKRDVGHRLALAALKAEYGHKIESSGPTIQSFAREAQTIRIRFSHAAGLKTSDGAAPRGFAIAGSDKKWKWAGARIDASSVVLSHPEVPNPTQIRYAWAENPDVNLYNAADLPAVPFRTDGP